MTAANTGRSGIVDLFVSAEELERRARGKTVVLFGAGNACRHTARRVGAAADVVVVDNNASLAGSEEAGHTVYGPDRLATCDRDRTLVVICTSAIETISRQLGDLGFTPVEHFVVSPSFLDLKVVEEIEALDVDLVFASGTPVRDDPLSGGGLYTLSSRGGEVEYRKVYSGFCYAVERLDGDYYTFDHHRGLVHLDGNFGIIAERTMPQGVRGHGIAFAERSGLFYVAATYLDQILIFDRGLDQVGSIEISDKFKRLGVPAHHINDIAVSGDSLFVSMFSQTGNWHMHIFDGAVCEIDIESHAMRGAVVDGLWMPHSLLCRDDGLYYLDSLRGELRRNTSPPFGRFPGFSRGLATDGRYFYVGQSKHRHHSRIREQSLNSSLDVSVIVYEPESRLSKSLPLPSKISEIHALVLP